MPKVTAFSNPFRTERSPTNKNLVNKSWDIVLGVLKGSGPVVVIDIHGFKNTATLRKHSIQVCNKCGYMQPLERIECGNCGNIEYESNRGEK
jgi:hypothetical protein